jgi:hypothetical protein
MATLFEIQFAIKFIAIRACFGRLVAIISSKNGIPQTQFKVNLYEGIHELSAPLQIT